MLSDQDEPDQAFEPELRVGMVVLSLEGLELGRIYDVGDDAFALVSAQVHGALRRGGTDRRARGLAAAEPERAGVEDPTVHH